MLGQSIVIENRGGGAGGSVGAKVVATADPDGYTILITPGGSLTTGPAVHKNIGYDPVKAFTPVGLLIETPQIMSVHPTLPVKTLAELVAYAKANPGKLTWGSQGFGTGPHLLAELFKLEAGVNIVHVPYRGTAPDARRHSGRRDPDGRRSPAPPVLPHIQAGKVRRIAVADDRAHAEIAGRADHGGGGLSEAATRRSGSAWWRRPARRPPSSTSSTPRSAKA